jgi:hypothetical protein
MTVNSALAEILDRQAAATEPDAVLAALVDHGVYVPVRGDGQIVFLQNEDGTAALPAYVSEECRLRRLPEASASVHCDVLRLMDITGQTKVQSLLLFADAGWARVPVPLVQQTLRQRGRQGNGERLNLSWTAADPHALALRAAFAEHIREHPAVRTVWISRARWVDTGIEQLMVHVEVDEPLPSASTQRLMEGVLAQVADAPEQSLGVIALNSADHAGFVAELERMGLDTVRIDRGSGRVTIVSREYDAPAPAGSAPEG